MKPPFYPIIYVRGYAGTQQEVEDTVATPYMGFNLGSTKIRQLWNRETQRHIFESPLIRLMKDHGYTDVYNDGDEIADGQSVPAKSVWIYRYYESVSKEVGTGVRPEIEDYARGLHELIEKIRDAVCGPASSAGSGVDQARAKFKVHLVAHSMGGLVVRCYLQNIYPGEQASAPAAAGQNVPPVDKVFTYATPHGGIDVRLIGNVPAFLQVNNIDNFNEKRMRDYLKLPSGPVTSLGGNFNRDDFFCLIGTNYRDYTEARGLSSAAVGPMSDGLVQIKNACVYRSPRAFVYRAHSGHYGIVNSEEGYQNLRRFLFGDVKIEVLLQINNISLPREVQKAREKDHEIRASYHIETIVRVRGARWDLSRRTVGETSAIFVPFRRIIEQRPLHLFTGYLLKSARVGRRRALGFSLDIGVLVPEYEVDKKWRLDDHYEGGYIFRDKVNFDLTLKHDAQTLKYGWDSKTPNRSTRAVEVVSSADGFEFQIPIVRKQRPGIDSVLIIRSKRRPW